MRYTDSVGRGRSLACSQKVLFASPVHFCAVLLLAATATRTCLGICTNVHVDNRVKPGNGGRGLPRRCRTGVLKGVHCGAVRGWIRGSPGSGAPLFAPLHIPRPIPLVIRALTRGRSDWPELRCAPPRLGVWVGGLGSPPRHHPAVPAPPTYLFARAPAPAFRPNALASSPPLSWAVFLTGAVPVNQPCCAHRPQGDGAYGLRVAPARKQHVQNATYSPLR